MIKIIKIQFKNLIRNKLLYVYYFAIFFWLMALNMSDIQFAKRILYQGNFIVLFGYAFMGAFLMNLIIFSDIFQNNIVLLGSNIKKDVLSRVFVCLSVILLNLIICIILFLIYYTISPVRFNQEYINQLIFVILEYGAIFIFSLAVSALIGRIFKKRIYIFIISFVLFLLFCNETRSDSGKNLYSVFAFIKSNYHIGTSSIFVNILSKDYLIHKFLMITTSIFLIYISYIINKFEIKDINKKNIAGIFTGILLIIVLLIYNKNYLPINYNQLVEKEAKIRYETNIKIKKYDMKISLDDYFKNECTMTLDSMDNMENEQELKLRLNQLFKIQGVYIGDKKLDYKHEDGVVKIKINKSIKDIKIVYKGYINALGNINEPVAFVTNKASFLPYDYLTWYPKGFDEEVKEYNVKVSSGSDVYINLDNKIKKDKLYQFSGKTKNILLISGYLNDYENEKLVCGRSNRVSYDRLKESRSETYKNIIETKVKKELLIPIDYKSYGDIDKLYQNECILVYNSRLYE